MNFDKLTKNKVTEFTCRHGDEVCKVTFEYDIECMEHVAKAFNTIAMFLGFSKEMVANHYIEDTYVPEPDNEDDYEEDPKSDTLEDKVKRGEWISFNEASPKEFGLDWVLVQFVENSTGFAGLPYIAELRNDGRWHLQSDNKQKEDFLNEQHYAASWKIIEKSPEFLASELNK